MRSFFSVFLLLAVYSSAVSSKSSILKLFPRHHRQAKCEIELNPDLTFEKIIQILCECVDDNQDALDMVTSLGETYGCEGSTCDIIACLAENGDEFSDDEVNQILEILEMISECTAPYQIVLDNNGLEGVEYGRALLNCLEELIDTNGNGNGDGEEDRK